LPRLVSWLRELETLGLRHVNLHLLESESEAIKADWALTDTENAEALLAVAAIHGLAVQPIQDMVKLLLGTDDESHRASCIWNACDPYTTSGVHGVLGDGTRVNCGRTNKDGVNWTKADTPSHVRQLVLYETPQADGGCYGCRFFFACKGNCPGTAIDGDWRNRTEHCGVLMRVFHELEGDLVRLGLRPISRDDAQRQTVEARMLAAYRSGSQLSVEAALRGDEVRRNVAHQDIPHGDHHGDHTDAP